MFVCINLHASISPNVCSAVPQANLHTSPSVEALEQQIFFAISSFLHFKLADTQIGCINTCERGQKIDLWQMERIAKLTSDQCESFCVKFRKELVQSD